MEARLIQVSSKKSICSHCWMATWQLPLVQKCCYLIRNSKESFSYIASHWWLDKLGILKTCRLQNWLIEQINKTKILRNAKNVILQIIYLLFYRSIQQHMSAYLINCNIFWMKWNRCSVAAPLQLHFYWIFSYDQCTKDWTCQNQTKTTKKKVPYKLSKVMPNDW